MGPKSFKLIEQAYEDSGMVVSVHPNPTKMGERFVTVCVERGSDGLSKTVDEVAAPLVEAGIARVPGASPDDLTPGADDPAKPLLLWSEAKGLSDSVEVKFEDFHSATSE